MTDPETNAFEKVDGMMSHGVEPKRIETSEAVTADVPPKRV